MSQASQSPADVAVVILNWNGGQDILRCLSSVFASRHVDLEVLIVDNGSVDGSSELIRNRFPQTHFIRNDHNLGFAKGSNQGMEWALRHGIRSVLLLNADARLAPDTIHLLHNETIRAHNSVVSCPKIYLGSDSTEHRIWFACGTVNLWTGLFQNPAFNQPDSARWSERCDMEYASGCCMLIPAEILLHVGLFDERFFAYCEDIDLSLRIREAGFALRYVPQAHVWHGSYQPTARTRSGFYRYLSTRNNLWVVRKHGSIFQALICVCILPARSIFRIARSLARADIGTVLSELRGARDGLLTRVTAH